MIRAIMFPSVLLILMFVCVIGVIHAQPHDNPALGAFGDCEVPCWRGLKVGTTSADDVVARIHAVGGLQVGQSQCYISDFCVMYTWRFADTQALYAFVEVNYGHVAAIDSSNPGFTVGEALLALKDLRVNGGDLDIGVESQFHINLYMAESSLVLRTITPCPGSYRALLETPVRILELSAPDVNGQFPLPVLTFPMFHRAFNRICGGL